MTTTPKHQILIAGGGTAGITVAARMLRKGYRDVAVIEPSTKHYYQPLWTLVGGGQAKASTTERSEASVMPKGATWIRNAAAAFDPDNKTVTCADGATHEYDVLVVCPGIQLDWNRTQGLEETLAEEKLKRQGIFNARFVRHLLQEHWAKGADHRKTIWTLLCFQLWHDRWAAG